MADSPTPVTFAVVTTNRKSTGGGMSPIFYADDTVERDRVAMWLSRITNCIVHDIHDGTLVLTVNATPKKKKSSNSNG